MSELPYKAFDEWQLQAEYDLETAESLLQSGRFVYVCSFCDLSIEKMLKAAWIRKFETVPPKTHSLIFLRDRLQITDMPDEKYDTFLMDLNSLSVPTRYPETLKEMKKLFTRERTAHILSQTKDIILWLKQI